MSNAIEFASSVHTLTWRSEELTAATAAPGWDLTERERNVAALLVEGLPYKEIAARLNISVNTVASHVKAILRKAGVNSSRRFAAIWQQRGTRV